MTSLIYLLGTRRRFVLHVLTTLGASGGISSLSTFDVSKVVCVWTTGARLLTIGKIRKSFDGAKNRFDVHEGALDWFTSYLTGRTQFVSTTAG